MDNTVPVPTVTVPMKPWYLSKVLWLAVAQAAVGILIVLGTNFPDLGWIAIAKSVLDVILRTLTTAPLV